MTMTEWELPPAAPGCGGINLTSVQMVTIPLDRCWVFICSKRVDPDSPTGLCDDCIEQLRYETNNEGGTQCDSSR